MIPQGKIEVVARAIWEAWRQSNVAPEGHREIGWDRLCALCADDNVACKMRTLALKETTEGLEAAAAWDREHIGEIVTDAAVNAAMNYTLDDPNFRAMLIRNEEMDGRGLMRRAIEAALREIGKCGG